jgi:tetratricopeptide (TPR) repeat protein
VERTWRRCRRNPVAASLAAALVLVVALGLAALTYLWLDAERHLDEAVRQRGRAETNLQEADRQRQLYEGSFRQARAAVDAFIRASERELYDKPGLEPARRKLFEIASKYHEEFVKQRGNDPALQRELAHFYEHTGNLLGPTQRQESLALHEKALRIREPLSRANPQDIELQADCASSYHNIATQKEHLGSPEEALRYYENSVTILDRLVWEHPQDDRFPTNLAKTYHNIGALHHKGKRAAEAAAYYTKAIGLKERLAARAPHSVALKLELARSFNNLGIHQGEAGKYADAHASFAKAEKLYEERAGAHPDNYVFQNGRAMAFRGMGMTLAKLGRLEDAAAAFRQAVRHQRAALDRAPPRGQDAAQYPDFLRSHYRLLAGVLRDLGRPAEAVTALLEQRKLAAGHPGELFQAARALALCVALVGKDQGKLTDSAKAERERVVGLALETLRWAVGAGYRGEDLQADAAFDALRSRPEFRKLLAELGQ